MPTKVWEPAMSGEYLGYWNGEIFPGAWEGLVTLYTALSLSSKDLKECQLTLAAP